MAPTGNATGPAPSTAAADASSAGRRLATAILVPLIAVGVALLLGSIVMLFSSFAKGGLDVTLPFRAYWSLFLGSFGDVNALVNTIVAAAPLILGGLAVGVGFKAGLFNIGAQGQFLLGALAAAAVGAGVSNQPAIVAIPLAILAAAIVGGLYGFLPGFLKAFTGAHEVVTTIMLNYVASAVLGLLVTGPFATPGASFARTGDVGNAALPILFGRNLHGGIILAFLVVPVIWWLLYRSTLGFEIRTVGANPSAARYAGMRPAMLIIVTMSLCGLLAGLAGGLEILGISHFVTTGYGTSVGFDSITVALLGRAHPAGILLAALLFGALRAGAGLMQIQAQVPVEIVDVIQALILLVLAADVIFRRIFRVRAPGVVVEELRTVTASYGEGRAV
jgi:simple sugar transport system permease protein